MRDFFIGALDKLIGVVAVLLVLAVLAGTVIVASGGGGQGQPSGIGPAIFILVGGLIYTVFVVGFMYLGLGVYHNTKRMAASLESRGM